MNIVAEPYEFFPEAIKKSLPPLYSQDGWGGAALARVKFFTPDAGWTWYASEGNPVLDDEGKEIDFQFFGLVDGLEKELGYFYLSELKEASGPLGLSVERDILWEPVMLAEIAPEKFGGKRQC